MKTYLRHRTVDELQALCERDGVQLLRDRYDDEGSDYVSLHWQGGNCMFNAVNGRFWGAHVGFIFDSNADQPQPWYPKLLDFFYTNEDAPK